MLPRDFVTVFEKLEKFYNKFLTEGQRDIWLEEVGYLTKEALEYSIKKIILCERNFPTPQVVIDFSRGFSPAFRLEKKEIKPAEQKQEIKNYKEFDLSNIRDAGLREILKRMSKKFDCKYKT